MFRVRAYVWLGERCEEWTANNVQYEPIELRKLKVLPALLTILISSCAHLGVGWSSCLFETWCIKDCHFAAISSWNHCLVDVTHQ